MQHFLDRLHRFLVIAQLIERAGDAIVQRKLPGGIGIELKRALIGSDGVLKLVGLEIGVAEHFVDARPGHIDAKRLLADLDVLLQMSNYVTLAPIEQRECFGSSEQRIGQPGFAFDRSATLIALLAASTAAS